jgi:hypothetical protein
MAAGWIAAAVLATVTGVAGVAVIGRGLSGPTGELMSADDIDRALAESGPTASPSATSAPTATATATAPSVPASADEAFRSPGGTVTAHCEGDVAVIVSFAPANGYRFRELDRARGVEAEVSFERSDEHQVKVEVTCPAGRPQFSVDEKD